MMRKLLQVVQMAFVLLAVACSGGNEEPVKPVEPIVPEEPVTPPVEALGIARRRGGRPIDGFARRHGSMAWLLSIGTMVPRVQEGNVRACSTTPRESI